MIGQVAKLIFHSQSPLSLFCRLNTFYLLEVLVYFSLGLSIVSILFLNTLCCGGLLSWSKRVACMVL